MRKTVNFTIGFLRIYFLGGLVGLLFLLFLILSDPYFKNLDWGISDDYVLKIEKFFLFSFYIPIWIMLAFGFLLILRSKSWYKKMMSLFQVFFGVVFFYFVDLKLKAILIFSNYIILNMIGLIIVYSLLLWISWKFIKRIND